MPDLLGKCHPPIPWCGRWSNDFPIWMAPRYVTLLDWMLPYRWFIEACLKDHGGKSVRVAYFTFRQSRVEAGCVQAASGWHRDTIGKVNYAWTSDMGMRFRGQTVPRGHIVRYGPDEEHAQGVARKAYFRTFMRLTIV